MCREEELEKNIEALETQLRERVWVIVFTVEGATMFVISNQYDMIAKRYLMK
jgi:hypothetical protein